MQKRNMIDTEPFGATVFYLFAYLTGILLTLYVRDGYYDLMESKAACFVFIVKLTAPFLLTTLVFRIWKKDFKRPDLFSISLLLFLVSSFVSTMLSYDRKSAFSGEQGWYVGFFTICSLILICLILKDVKRIKEEYLLPLVPVCVFEFAMTIMAGMGIDLFRLKQDFGNTSFYRFFGTIGNSNWYVGYLSLLVPLFSCLYISEKNRMRKAVFFAASVTGIWASVINGADGIYLAYGLCVFAVIPFILKEQDHIKRTAVLLSAFAAGLLFIGYSPLFAEFLSRLTGYGKILLKPLTAAGLLMPGLFMYAITIKTDPSFFSRNRSRIIRIAEGIMILASVIFACLTLNHLDAGFGNGRLAIWSVSFRTLIDRFPLKMKLFGIGPELLRNVYASISSPETGTVNSSHSELIQVLLTTGLFGFVFWMGCWIGIVVRFIQRKRSADALSTGLFCGIIAYFGQSLVNSATTLNLCILTIFVILLYQEKD